MSLGRFVVFFVMLAGTITAQTPGTYRVVLEPKLNTIISSEITSTVKILNKKMGDKFKEGELLMQLDDTIFVFNLKKSEALKHNADTNLNTISELFNEKSASQTQLSEAQAAVAAAAADLALSQKALNSCHIIGPYNGKVQEVFVEEYERVEPGQKLIDVIDDSILIAKLLIESEFVEDLEIGKVLMIRIPSENKLYPATITHIAAGINPASSLIKVDATIDNHSEELKAGMIGVVEIAKKKPIQPVQEPNNEPMSIPNLPEKIPPSVKPKQRTTHGP